MGQDIPQRENILGKGAEAHVVGKGCPGQHVCPSSGVGRQWRSLSSVMLRAVVAL